MAMKERFTVTELCALRNDLIQGGMVDSREAAELLQVVMACRKPLPSTPLDEWKWRAVLCRCWSVNWKG
jgi:hypothetical protein